MGDDYLEYLARAYGNSDIWKNHRLELDNFYEYTKRHNIRFIVLVWPQLARVEETSPFTSRVKEVFTKLGVPAIDLALLFKTRDPRKLTVNSFDAHPNEAVHREVAGLILKEISQHQ